MRIRFICFLKTIIFGLPILVTWPTYGDKCPFQFAAITAQLKNNELKAATGFTSHEQTYLFGSTIPLSFPERYKNRIFYQKIEKISEQPKTLRNHLRALKRKSVNADGTQIEVGEIMFQFKDGSRQTVRFHSSNSSEISQEAGTAALNESGILDRIDEIAGVLDIHTHPNLGTDRKLLISDDDIVSARSLKAQLENILRRRFDYRILMAPNCNNCDDVVMTVNLN